MCRNKEAVLNDKSNIDELKPLYDAYGSMDVPSMYDKQVYEDEYDDTYDALNVGADDADSADELTQQRCVQLGTGNKYDKTDLFTICVSLSQKNLCTVAQWHIIVLHDCKR